MNAVLCGSCEAKMMYVTDTPDLFRCTRCNGLTVAVLTHALCFACAIETGLCAHCGFLRDFHEAWV